MALNLQLLYLASIYIFAGVFAGYSIGYITHEIHPLTVGLIWYGWASFAGLFLTAVQLKKDIFKYAGPLKQRLLYPVLGSLDALGWFFGIHLLGLSGQTAVSKANIVFLALYGIVFLREGLAKRKLVLLILIIVGVVLFSAETSMPSQKMGVLVVLFTAFSYSAATIVLRKQEKKHIQSLIALRSLIVFIGLCLFATISEKYNFSVPSLKYVVWIFLGSSSAAIVSHYVSYLILQHAKMTTFSVIIALTPIVSFLTGMLFLHEKFSFLQLVAAIILILAGGAYSITKQNKRGDVAKVGV